MTVGADQIAACVVCNSPLTEKQLKRGFLSCSVSCGAKRRGAAFRQIPCAVPGCDGFGIKAGHCEKHYSRIRSHGTTVPFVAYADMSESERFWSKVCVGAPDQCWEWLGEKNNHGYGRFATYLANKRRRHLAHRYALADLGLLDPTLVIMHRCDNPPCCNPAHLAQGTQLENIRDAKTKGRMDTAGLQKGRESRAALRRRKDTA